MKWFLFFYLISNVTFGEPFSTGRVELKNHELSSPFGVLRDINGKKRYHAGVDYASKPPMEADYSAGVWGVLQNVNDSPYSAIIVKPLHIMEYYIQYLHNTKRYLKDGDIVAPWTIIGRTDKAAPADEPVTDTHLHLQVWTTSGNPQHSDWTRNYVDPEQWDTGNPFKLPGDQMWAWKAIPIDTYGLRRDGHQYFKFEGDKIGDPVALSAVYTFLKGGNFFCRTEYRYRGNIIKRKINTIIAKLVYQDFTCTERCRCHPGAPEEVEFGLNKLGKVDWPAASSTHVPENIVSGGRYSKEEGVHQEISGKKFDPKDTIDLILGVSNILKK